MQAAPKPGEPTAFDTTVRVLRDAQRLYFGTVAHDPRPEALVVHAWQRDANLRGDDNVVLVLGAFSGARIGGYENLP